MNRELVLQAIVTFLILILGGFAFWLASVNQASDAIFEPFECNPKPKAVDTSEKRSTP